jgi:hypothetical protein
MMGFAPLNPSYTLHAATIRKCSRSPHLSTKMRIMAALPQFLRSESNKEREMILCFINGMAHSTGIS